MIACEKCPEISHKIEAMVQIPDPLEDSDNQIPSSPVRQRCPMPRVCPGGGGGSFRFDLTDALHLHKMVEKTSKNITRTENFQRFFETR